MKLWGEVHIGINKNELLICIAFFVLSICSLRFFFIGSNFDAVGHNWDWGFPATDFLLNRIQDLSLFSWNERNLGITSNLQSHLIPNFIVSLLSNAMSPKLVTLSILLCTLTCSFFSFKKNADLLLGQESLINYLPSLLYAFSPFLFNEVLGGSW